MRRVPVPPPTDIMGSRVVVVQLRSYSQSCSRDAGAETLIGCVLGKPWSWCPTNKHRVGIPAP